MASTSAVRCAGTALRAAVIRVAVTGGLALLACVFGSAVANAATSSDAPQANVVADTLHSDLSELVNGLLTSLGGQHHLLGLPGGVQAIQPPADDDGTSGTAGGAVNPGGPQSSSSGGGATSTWPGSSDSGGDVWTGSTTVTVPAKTTPEPPQPPAPPVAPPPVHVQPAPPPVNHKVDQAATSSEPSVGAPAGVVPDLPQHPIDLPLQQPASQPISSPSTGGTASHDLGGANGIADIVPPGGGFRPSPGSTTDEHSPKRVSDGAPGLPSTSPD